MAEEETPTKPSRKRRPPATTPEAEENHLIALATNRAKQMLEDGTAPTSVINHFLKLGSTRETLEKEKIRKENELLRAKVDAIESAKEIKALYEEALIAMRVYKGDDD